MHPVWLDPLRRFCVSVLTLSSVKLTCIDSLFLAGVQKKKSRKGSRRGTALAFAGNHAVKPSPKPPPVDTFAQCHLCACGCPTVSLSLHVAFTLLGGERLLITQTPRANDPFGVGTTQRCF